MNNLLLNLYSQYWDGMIQNVYKADEVNHPSSYPILIQATPHYQNATKRVMFCGQETYGWGREFPNPDATTPNKLMGVYNGFVNKNWGGKQIKKPGYNSPYWNFQWNIMKRFPDVGYVAQNIVKIGKRSKTGCDDFIFQRTLEHFPVWNEELKILRPDCIIFLTGSYDWRIRKAAGDFDVKHVEGVDGLLDQLIFKDPAMPIAFRTNHPRALQSKGKYYLMADAISDIISKL